MSLYPFPLKVLEFWTRSSAPLQRLKNSYVALAMRGFFKLEYELNLESKFPTLSRGMGIVNKLEKPDDL